MMLTDSRRLAYDTEPPAPAGAPAGAPAPQAPPPAGRFLLVIR